MNDEKKIPDLSNAAQQEKVLNYLNGKMNDASAHEFEKTMNEDAFMADAMEGLEKVKDKEQLTVLVHQMNTELKKQVKLKKTRKEKRIIIQDQWMYFAVILLLILTVVAFVVIKKFY
ncbi:MAG: hypothetical protein ABIP80_03250 [Ferruginibacter sp.]